MNLKSGILSLLLGAVLFGAGAAQADDDRRRDDRREWNDGDYDDRHRASPIGVEVHVHGPSCHHAPAPEPRPNGRYELRTMQRWVPGYTEQVWVPEVCETKHKHKGHGRGHGYGRRTVTTCRAGYYEQQQVAGRYEQVEEWVWVPTVYRRGGVGVQVTANF